MNIDEIIILFNKVVSFAKPVGRQFDEKDNAAH